MKRILIADDHAILREGLKLILSEISGLEQIDETGFGREVITLVRRNDYDLVLLDISLPDMNGLEVLKVIKTEKPDTKVLILSIYPEDQYALRVLRTGAWGYLNKESAPEELISAVNKVASGKKYISEYLVEKFAEDASGDLEKPLHDSLTEREMEVMQQILKGKQLKEIADYLNISIKTVSTYKSRILTKLKVDNIVDIIHYAIKHNLTE